MKEKKFNLLIPQNQTNNKIKRATKKPTNNEKENSLYLKCKKPINNKKEMNPYSKGINLNLPIIIR
jgi:hypothetical protein